LERSLTVLLAVHNAQDSLRETVQEILEVVPELTRRFDVLIVDDGSTDGTGDVASELAASYPQVRIVSRGRSLGRDAAVSHALNQPCGDVILLWDAEGGVPAHSVHELWRAASGPSSVTAPVYQRPVRRFDPKPVEAKRRGGYRLMQRAMLAPARRAELLRRPWWCEPAETAVRTPNYLARLKKFAAGQ